MNGSLSTPLTTCTGAPQGCVLSSLLFSLYTNGCLSKHPSVKRIKFADDTTMPGLISNNDETAYRTEVQDLVDWCDCNNLILNTTKTHELIIDFRKSPSNKSPLNIKGEDIQQVPTAKFLGTVLNTKLTWEKNTEAIRKKAQQRLYFLRLLKKFRLRREILKQFYSATIESILTFSCLVWYGNLTVKDKHSLQKIVNRASKITGAQLPSLEEIYAKRASKKARKIATDPSHPSFPLFELLPSGRRYRAIKTKTVRFRQSFYPSAVAILSQDLKSR